MTPLRKQADFQLVVDDERTYRIFEGGKANECGAIHMCSLRPCGAMGTDRLAPLRAKGQETASAYRQGNAGRPSRQGEILAMAADPLVLRPRVGREAGDAQQGQENAWGRRSHLAISGC